MEVPPERSNASHDGLIVFSPMLHTFFPEGLRLLGITKLFLERLSVYLSRTILENHA